MRKPRAFKHPHKKGGTALPAERDDFWDYFERWKNIFKDGRPLEWQDEWLENAWCGECRFCCGPQGTDKAFPMALLPAQMQPGYREHFYLLNDNTAFLAGQGCRSDSATGCVLKRKERPVACGLFPIVLANGKLYLYISCPATLFLPLARFYEIGRKAANMLLRYSLEELRHLSLELDLETLSAKYVDLHIDIFNKKGKCQPFEHI